VKFFSYLGRFFVMWTVMWYLLWVYALRRIGLQFTDKTKRKARVSALRGEVLRRGMTTLGATFVKLGQVLSTRPDLLEPEVIEELRKLQDRLPPFKLAKARQIVEADLGKPIEECFKEFEKTPVAAASVAQVYRAVLHDGTEVAVKVLRPDVRKKVERDAVVLLFAAKIMNLHPRAKLSDPVGHLRHFVDGIIEQTDLRNEVKNYERFRKTFEKVTHVRFPATHVELSGERVMTMEFIRGTKVDSLPAGGDHKALARRIQDVLLKMCFQDGFMHADLHPGNLVLHETGDLAIFDVGLCKDISREVLDQLMDFTKCLTMGTPHDFVLHLKKFHKYIGEVDWAGVERDVTEFLGRFRGRNVGQLEMGALFNDVFALARTYRVRPPAELALVMVGIVTAEGIGKQLHPENNLFESVASFIMPLLAERGLMPPAPPPAKVA
jgi:ubiquinone biosynthesis protein